MMMMAMQGCTEVVCVSSLFVGKRSTTTLTRRGAPIAKITNRYLSLSVPFEPPLDSTIPEKPCTLILAEDSLYKKKKRSSSSSWHNYFQHQIPHNHGITYREWSMSTTSPCVDTVISELKNDLKDISHDAVLVARGPFISWMAFWYLESWPLAGLVLVDPIPLDDNDGIKALERYYKEQQDNNIIEMNLLQEFAEHWDHWTLRLEPGVPVPMLIMTETQQFEPYAKFTKKRHSFRSQYDDDEDEDEEDDIHNNDEDDEIPILSLLPQANEPNNEAGGASNNNNNKQHTKKPRNEVVVAAAAAEQIICNWIDERVL